MNEAESNKELVKAFIETVLVNHELDSVNRFLREDYIQHNPDAAQGSAGFVEFFKMMFKAMPDFRYTINRLLAEGDNVWAWCTTTATHNGGQFLDIPPSGRKLSFDVVDLFRVQDGKIAEHWDVADTLTMFSQLGDVETKRARQ